MGFLPRGLGREVWGFVRAAAGPGCSRLAAVGAGALFALCSVTPASRWSAVPVDIESAPRAAQVDPAREEVERLLGTEGWQAPALRARVARAVVEEAKAAGLDPLLVMAVIAVESEGRPGAVSSRGALGLMQLRPPTLRFVAEAEGLGVPAGDRALQDPELNVRLGIRYLHRLIHAFGSLGVALVAYNAGPHRVSGYLRAHEPIPEQLRGYPHRVRREYLKLVAGLGGAPGLSRSDLPLGREVAWR